MEHPDIDWKKVVHRKTFIVAKNEVIFFIDEENTIFIFISFPSKDIVDIYEQSSTTQWAKQLLDAIDMDSARSWYYRLKKQTDS